jgi:hypothetical protein
MYPQNDGLATLFLVHGRGVKPPEEVLKQHWHRALAHGLARDHQLDLSTVRVQMIYYADLTNRLDPGFSKYDEVLDIADRDNAFQQLAELDAPKSFRRSRYEAVPGQSPLREFLADLGAPAFRLLGLSSKRLARYYPELAEYWSDEDLAGTIRGRLVRPLGEALRRGDHIMVISHCTGSVVSYDAFWEASQEVDSTHQRVHTWVTLGSPLADDDVRGRLNGQPKSFPNLLINWHNVAAEDDPVCHDETMANDFKAMLEERHISRIQDYHIYNLTERYGKSDPHAAPGYLIHPRTSSLVADWINSRPGT